MATWHSSESRCMFRLTEGMAETQELAWGAETDSMRALLAGEAEETKVWNIGCQVLKIGLLLRGSVKHCLHSKRILWRNLGIKMGNSLL